MTDSFAKATSERMNYYDSPVHSGLVRKLDGRCDELNLFLTANGLKPASTVTFNTKARHSKSVPDPVTVNKDEISQFRNLLDALGLPRAEYGGRYSPFKRIMRRHSKGHLRRTNDYDAWINFDIGKDDESLNRLTEAGKKLLEARRDGASQEIQAKLDEWVGLAYGYPKEAAWAFRKVIDGEKRDGGYLMGSMVEARDANVKIPTWMAYISHIPEQLDFVNGRVSPSSEALGEKYQSFVRKYAPELARRLDESIERFNE